MSSSKSNDASRFIRADRWSTARLLSDQSGDLTASYRPLAELERQRRAHYRQTHSGKLPWEVRGLSGSTSERIPQLALDVVGGDEGLPEIDSEALDSESPAGAEPLPSQKRTYNRLSRDQSSHRPWRRLTRAWETWSTSTARSGKLDSSSKT